MGPHQISTVIQTVRHKHKSYSARDLIPTVAVQDALDEFASEFAKRFPAEDRAAFLEAAKKRA